MSNLSSTLNESLAIAKQYFEELTRLADLDELARGKYPPEPAKTRVNYLLRRLNAIVASTEKAMSLAVSKVGEPPVVTVSSGNLTFYRSQLEPNIKRIRRAFLDSEGFEGLADLLDSVSSAESTGRPIGSAVSWGMERWIDMVPDDERRNWLERGFDLDGAFDLVSEPWFLPDAWRENAQMLRPILVDRPATKIRAHILHRLAEIYGSFIFGFWMAAIALSRSAVEFAVRDSAPALKVQLSRTNSKGEVEEKRLWELTEEIGASHPQLRDTLEAIRDTGNRILHPKKRDVVAFPKVLRAEALECIKNTRFVLETLYSER